MDAETTTEITEESLNLGPPPSLKTVTFYYSWYGNPKHNKEWLHWNHKILVDGGSSYQPPDEIGANFYPLLGPYSSIDPLIVEEHMKQMRSARIGVICLSWWGANQADSQIMHIDGYTDSTLSLILDTAHKYGLKVCLHHEPYQNRNPQSVVKDIKYAIDKYGDHPAFFRWAEHGNRPIFFVYDAYLTSKDQWSTILSPSGHSTIRNTKYDSIFIALYVDSRDEEMVMHANFDGVYTYFATDGFTQGSTTRNWERLANWAGQRNKIFIPSVGPGYDDTRIRPWNAQNRRSRQEGKYYDNMWQAAVNIGSAGMVSITSYNEWHEGTQIEPSMPYRSSVSGYQYVDFSPQSPNFYLERTRHWVDQYDPSPL